MMMDAAAYVSRLHSAPERPITALTHPAHVAASVAGRRIARLLNRSACAEEEDEEKKDTDTLNGHGDPDWVAAVDALKPQHGQSSCSGSAFGDPSSN
jgi:hypothetical protein